MSDSLTNIQPLRLADVRHVGRSDVLSATTISSVTAALAVNQNSTAEKINELLAILKEGASYLPVVLPRVTLQAGGSTTIYNFRIPRGFQATIVNAKVASLPSGNKAVLQLLHSPGTFGQDGTGNGVVELVITTDESNIAGNYVGEGEIIFKVSSTATSRISVVASVLLILKPLS
jgi:hypothetical protein